MGSPQTPKLPYSPQLTAELAEMEEFTDEALLRSHDADPDDVVSGIVEQRALELWEAGKMKSLAEFEACLRGIGSRAYCLAIPAEDFTTWNPVDATANPKFVLAVANGRHKASAMMQEWSMDSRENSRRLAVAGLLKSIA